MGTVAVDMRKLVAVLLIITTLAVINTPAVNDIIAGTTSPVVLKVNWGAIVKDVAMIVGGAAAIVLAPEITVPVLVGAYLSGGAGAFDLAYNRCEYGINIGC